MKSFKGEFSTLESTIGEFKKDVKIKDFVVNFEKVKDKNNKLAEVAQKY